MDKPALKRVLSGVDAAFLYLEGKEIPLHIASVSIFDGPVSFERFVESIDSKLHLIPRYRQIVVPAPFNLGHPVLEDDPHFDIARHIFRVNLDPPGGEAALEALASRILSERMDRTKPLWDIHVAEDMGDGRGAMVVRLHHSLADGIAGTSVMKALFDATPESSQPARPPRFHPPKKVPAYQLMDALRNAIQGTLDNLVASQATLMGLADGLSSGRMSEALKELLRFMPELAAANERLPFNRPCGPNRKFCWAQMSFAEVHEIKKALGGTINDVLATILMRAIAKYVRAHGETVAGGRLVRVICPVNIRNGGDGATHGNQITFLPVALPLDCRYPARHLHSISARMAVMKNAGAAHLMGLAANFIGAAPPPLQSLFWSALSQLILPVPLFNLIFTNIPGSPDPLYAGGRHMLTSYPHVPTGYELGVNVAVQSYDGKIFWGFTADADAAPDVGTLRDFLYPSLEELCHSAGLKKAPQQPAAPEPRAQPAARKPRAQPTPRKARARRPATPAPPTPIAPPAPVVIDKQPAPPEAPLSPAPEPAENEPVAEMAAQMAS